MKKNHTHKLLPIASAVMALFLVGCDENKNSYTPTEQPTAPTTTKPAEAEKPVKAITLDQGWSKDEALDFYNTSQGSHLIPYAWFLVLEQSNNQDLFRDDKNIKKFGYIPQTELSGRNPDALPIGFVKDDIPDVFLSTALHQTRIAASTTDNQMGYNEWLGLTCSACHTSEMHYDNQVLRIDGGPSLSDMQTFLKEMSAALTATVNDDAKLTRFAKQVLAKGGFNETEKQALKTQVNNYINWLNTYINTNYAKLESPYGYGRLDAFGAILNRVTASLLNIPSNSTPSNAPVSFPYLWNASQLDWVQWNGSADNHIGRNMGEVSGVFAHTILNTDNAKERFYSSGKVINLLLWQA